MLDAPLSVAPLEIPAGLVAPPSVRVVRWSDAGYASTPTDSPANALFEARILDDIVLSQRAVDALGAGGVVALTASEVALANWDRALDDMIRLGAADGRAVTIRAAPRVAINASDGGTRLADAPTAWAGIAGGFTAPGNRASLRLSDLTERLVTDLQPSRYGGTGGMDGAAELTGLPKPVSLGRRFNVAPVFVGEVDLGDGLLPTFATHWRAIAGHDAVRERGLAMTEVGAAPTTGQWRDWPAQGAFQLGFTPNGAITCDVRGDNVGAYVDTTGTVLRRLLTSLGPQYAIADFDDAAWTQAETDLPGPIGWGIGAEATSALAAVQEILAGAGAFLAGSRFGRLRLVALRAPAEANMEIDAEDVLEVIARPAPADIVPTPQAVEIRARANWQRLTDIAGSVGVADRVALGGDGQTARVISASVAARSVKSRTLALPGLYWNSSDAEARATALLAWIAPGVRMMQVTTDRFLGQVELGHVARVTAPDLGLAAGFTGLVVGWEERLAARRLSMTLLG